MKKKLNIVNYEINNNTNLNIIKGLSQDPT